MALVSGQDSNQTSVRYAFESSLGVLPGTPDWILAEPNSEPEFGSEVELKARRPINSDRQSLKGDVVDFKAGVSIEQDFTVLNQMFLLQAPMMANLRALVVAATLTTISSGTTINGTGMGGFAANDVVLLEGSGLGCDGIYLVASATATTVVTSGLTNGTMAAGATLTKVGIQCASGDINIAIAGNFATYTSTATNFTTRLALAPGQSVFVGGDLTPEQFNTLGNNGDKRVRSVTATALVVDKSVLPMSNETGTGKTIRFYVTAALKNEQGILFVQKPIQWERMLGAPDDALPAQVQSQYEVGCLCDEFSLEAKPTELMTTNYVFMGKDEELRTGAQGVKSGNRPALRQANGISASAAPRHIRVSRVDTANESATALWQLTESLSFKLKNNLDRNLALGVVGSARFGTGFLDVDGTMNAYFTDIGVLGSARNNHDVTTHMFVAAGDNTGFSVDFPLQSLKVLAVVEQNKPIMAPCQFTAHSGEKVDPALDHTLMWTFFKYLPALAQTQP
jgi:hypothetical protein